MTFIAHWLKIAGCLLYALGDACDTFSRKFSAYRKSGIKPQSLQVVKHVKQDSAPVAGDVSADVIDALVGQGAAKKQAKEAVSEAMWSLPGDAGFEDLFRASLQVLRRAA